ncbi:hypothetical protein PO587_06220 [Streptomyces gilvifuscus]|uniref:Gram-positive cocci surface proteins LPxTG domain-containing protein n=1 Tax=Streptomyces gilvifuscus TaxID=1550617 RepID=A0ABT5FNF3_9ACTN|nr:hypothetical protein [Streptomyces gilvifuscus]MDC2954044.1 hypothetical protein [Streptomyces gilvifuscus]
MLQSSPGLRPLRLAVGTLGAVALTALGVTPATAADDSGAVLTLSPIAPVSGVKPGASFDVPASFTDSGSASVGKVYLSYSVTRGLSHTELPSNCLRYEVASFDEAPSKSEAVCEFDQTVKPGVVYAPEKSLTLKALDRALYDRLRVVVATDDPAPTDGAAEPVRGTGPAVKLVERPDDKPAQPGHSAHPDWDAVDVAVTAENTADFQVTGADLKGRVGDTVGLTVRFTNAGPAWVLRDGDIPVTKVKIRMPAGTTVTKAHDFCDKVATGSYECGTSQAWENEGEGETYTFKLRIDKAVPGAKGSVSLGGAPRPFDDHKANDKADITLDVAGSGGSTGGSGSTGGTGSSTSGGGTGGSSTGGSTSTGGGSATGGGSSTSGTSAQSGSGGDLASTGSGAVLPVAGAAAAAVAVGAGAVVVARRRRASR